jgi:hypothetical protein
MSASPTVVVTSINRSTAAMHALAEGCRATGMRFIVVGDTKSPSDFSLEGCEFFDIAAQLKSGLAFAGSCPTRHYARKNVGYLLAVRDGAPLILETDDDNAPLASFFVERRRRQRVGVAATSDWINVYRYFSDALIWPRGLPLDRINSEPPAFDALPPSEVDCPIQQGLANANPDVDAIYRLVLPLPQDFRGDRRVALAPGTWCPFNSQNTTWWPDAYPLLYLPAYCSFRMTDIWRSFVAQRISGANGWHVLFHEPTVWQDRNEHDLMRDFADELPGYLNNERIRRTLDDLAIAPGKSAIPDNLRLCYEALVKLDVIGAGELTLLEAWLGDLAAVGLR